MWSVWWESDALSQFLRSLVKSHLPDKIQMNTPEKEKVPLMTEKSRRDLLTDCCEVLACRTAQGITGNAGGWEPSAPYSPVTRCLRRHFYQCTRWSSWRWRDCPLLAAHVAEEHAMLFLQHRAAYLLSVKLTLQFSFGGWVPLSFGLSQSAVPFSKRLHSHGQVERETF